MESSKHFKDEKVFQGEVGDPTLIKTNENLNYEKFKLTLRPDGSATLFREYHFYYTRNNENYDDQVDTIATLEGTYELSVDDAETMIIILHFRKRSLHSTGFMGNLEQEIENEEVDISFNYIERKWRKAVGFTSKKNIFANFDDMSDYYYFRKELGLLRKLGIQDNEGMAELRKHNKDIKKILKENFPDPKIEEGLNFLKKRIFVLNDSTEEWDVDMTISLIQFGGDPVKAYENKDEYFRLFQNLLRNEGIVDIDGAFEAFRTCPVSSSNVEDSFKWYKRKDVFAEQTNQLRNYYGLQENEIEDVYKHLLSNEGKLQSVLRNLKPARRYKKELELLKQDGFIDEETNLTLLTEWTEWWNKFEWNYEEILVLFKNRTDERTKKDLGYLASEFGLCDINHKAFLTYLKHSKNVNLTGLELLKDKGNESASLINFTLKCKCLVGQGVYLSGNLNELGSWDLKRAKKMTLSEEDTWIVEVLFVNSPSIAYKYFQSSSDESSSDYMNDVIWENRGEREFTKDVYQGEYSLTDSWE